MKFGHGDVYQIGIEAKLLALAKRVNPRSEPIAQLSRKLSNHFWIEVGHI